jgi:hypothetical protein
MTLVDELRDRFGVEPVLRVLDVAASTFYVWVWVWQAADPCDRDLVDLGLLSNIYQIWDASGRCACRERHPSSSGCMLVLPQDAAETVASVDGQPGEAVRVRYAAAICSTPRPATARRLSATCDGLLRAG